MEVGGPLGFIASDDDDLLSFNEASTDDSLPYVQTRGNPGYVPEGGPDFLLEAPWVVEKDHILVHIELLFVPLGELLCKTSWVRYTRLQGSRLPTC